MNILLPKKNCRVYSLLLSTWHIYIFIRYKRTVAMLFSTMTKRAYLWKHRKDYWIWRILPALQAGTACRRENREYWKQWCLRLAAFALWTDIWYKRKLCGLCRRWCFYDGDKWLHQKFRDVYYRFHRNFSDSVYDYLCRDVPWLSCSGWNGSSSGTAKMWQAASYPSDRKIIFR